MRVCLRIRGQADEDRGGWRGWKLRYDRPTAGEADDDCRERLVFACGNRGGVRKGKTAARERVAPEDVATPVQSLIVPSFLRGELAQNAQSYVQYGADNPAHGLLAAWNLGQLLGLPGLFSLLPLGLVWMVAGYLLMSRFRER